MAITTYDELKTEIQSWLADDDIADNTESFIAQCESNMRRTVRIPQLMVKEQVTISDGDRTTDLTSLASTFQDMKYIRILETANNHYRFSPALQQLSVSQLSEVSKNIEWKPSCFAVYGTTVEYDVEADQDYTAEFFFWKQFDALSASNASNEILANHPDLYLWGSLTVAAPFLDNDERIQVWGGFYEQALKDVRRVSIENNLGGPIKARTRGVPPRKRY